MGNNNNNKAKIEDSMVTKFQGFPDYNYQSNGQVQWLSTPYVLKKQIFIKKIDKQLKKKPTKFKLFL